MDTIQVVHRHIKEKRHKKNVKEHVQVMRTQLIDLVEGYASKV